MSKVTKREIKNVLGEWGNAEYPYYLERLVDRTKNVLVSLLIEKFNVSAAEAAGGEV